MDGEQKKDKKIDAGTIILRIIGILIFVVPLFLFAGSFLIQLAPIFSTSARLELIDIFRTGFSTVIDGRNSWGGLLLCFILCLPVIIIGIPSSIIYRKRFHSRKFLNTFSIISGIPLILLFLFISYWWSGGWHIGEGNNVIAIINGVGFSGLFMRVARIFGIILISFLISSLPFAIVLAICGLSKSSKIRVKH